MASATHLAKLLADISFNQDVLLPHEALVSSNGTTEMS